MKYTEEEFYGNTQNTILENGELEPATGEDAESGNRVDIGGTIFVTFLKTLACIVGAVFYFMAVCVCLSPSFSIQVFDFLGAKQASLACYERIYEQSGSLVDLYNLVQKSIQVKNYKKTSKYIDLLQNSSGYQEFCVEVNEATISVTDIKYVAYVGDLDGYLVSQNILAYYERGEKDKAREVAIWDLTENHNVYSFGVSVYVECLMGDTSMTTTQRSEKLTAFANENVNGQAKTVLDYTVDKLEMADYTTAENGSVDQILKVYTCLKIENLRLRIYENMGEEGLANETREKISVLQSKYSELVNR